MSPRYIPLLYTRKSLFFFVKRNRSFSEHVSKLNNKNIGKTVKIYRNFRVEFFRKISRLKEIFSRLKGVREALVLWQFLQVLRQTPTRGKLRPWEIRDGERDRKREREREVEHRRDRMRSGAAGAVSRRLLRLAAAVAVLRAAARRYNAVRCTVPRIGMPTRFLYSSATGRFTCLLSRTRCSYLKRSVSSRWHTHNFGLFNRFKK